MLRAFDRHDQALAAAATATAINLLATIAIEGLINLDQILQPEPVTFGQGVAIFCGTHRRSRGDNGRLGACGAREQSTIPAASTCAGVLSPGARAAALAS
jgi:hypothetical protein